MATDDFVAMDSNRNVLSFISFQKHLADAKANHELTLRLQLRFWEELLKPNPELEVLDKLSMEVSEAVAASRGA